MNKKPMIEVVTNKITISKIAMIEIATNKIATNKLTTSLAGLKVVTSSAELNHHCLYQIFIDSKLIKVFLTGLIKSNIVVIFSVK